MALEEFLRFCLVYVNFTIINWLLPGFHHLGPYNADLLKIVVGLPCFMYSIFRQRNLSVPIVPMLKRNNFFGVRVGPSAIEELSRIVVGIYPKTQLINVPDMILFLKYFGIEVWDLHLPFTSGSSWEEATLLKKLLIAITQVVIFGGLTAFYIKLRTNRLRLILDPPLVRNLLIICGGARISLKVNLNDGSMIGERVDELGEDFDDSWIIFVHVLPQIQSGLPSAAGDGWWVQDSTIIGI